MSKTLQVTGTIVNIGESKDVGKAKPYLKRTFALADPDSKEEYPNWFVFEMGGTNIDKILEHGVGDVVTVSFNLKGRQWQDRWFSNTEAWRIESVSKAASVAPTDGPELDSEIPF